MTKTFRTLGLASTLVIIALLGGMDFAGWLSGTVAITGAPVRSLNPYIILLGLINVAVLVAGSPSAWWLQR
jgi:hypothetical protein